MKKKTTDILWAVSLFVIGITTIIIAGANIIGARLPDFAVRILGIAEIIALPVLIYSTVRKLKFKE